MMKRYKIRRSELAIEIALRSRLELLALGYPCGRITGTRYLASDRLPQSGGSALRIFINKLFVSNGGLFLQLSSMRQNTLKYVCISVAPVNDFRFIVVFNVFPRQNQTCSGSKFNTFS